MERAATLLWWVLLVACAVGLWAAHAAAKGGGPGEGPPAGEEAAGRWALGAARAKPDLPVLERLDLPAMAPAARLRMVPVVAEIAGVEKAKEMLEELRGKAPRRDFEDFWRIYGELAPPTTDEGFVRRNGWFARLALSRGLPDSHPLRKELLAEARRAFLGSSIAIFLGLLALGAGIALLPIGLSRLRRGRLRLAYEPPPRTPGDRVWLETVTLLLAGVIATLFFGALSVWALLLVPFWPLARGVGRAEWRSGLGFSRGAGLVQEIGAGLLGYLAGMPVFLVGILASVFLARVLGEPLSHPAMEDVGKGGLAARIELLLAACVWAPLVEEAVFRGALLRYLRPRMSRLLAAAVVGLVFAFVHPQGIAGIPALMAIGGWFAVLREWRGTLVPSMAAHAIHNLVLVSLSILILG
ncbi:MAG TPA: type II CAAX endopeptidase family protein [Planctomycetota bacterium]|nr:type II CAAX endopeptidase family protein [Planctomycetota bacterium]